MKMILSVLSGDIWNDNGVWRTNDMDVRYGKAVRAIVDSFRIPAAAARVQGFKKGEATVFVQGGLADATYPSLASVMKRELMELGVLEAQIESEEQSQTTYQQLFLLQDRVAKEQSVDVEILSSEWHLPRVQAMLECVPGLAALHARNPHCVAAEEILLRADPVQWEKRIKAVRTCQDIRARTALEQEGVAQIRNGTYRFR